MKYVLIFLFTLALDGPIFAEIICGEILIKIYHDEKIHFMLKKNNFIYEKYRLFDKEDASLIKFLKNEQGYCLEGKYIATYPMSFVVAKIVAIRS